LLENIQGVRPSIGKIIDINGEESVFDIAEYKAAYEKSKALIERIIYKKEEPEPIIGGKCKECVWSKPCHTLAVGRNDPTLLFYLGKQKYQLRERGICTIDDLCGIDEAAFADPSKKIRGATHVTLEKWKRRAAVWNSKKPIVHKNPNFRKTQKEVYYDIEDDPSMDHVYLHGLIEVVNGTKGEYKSFFAGRREEEGKAARDFCSYVESLSESDVIYHYGAHEKTKMKRLKEKYSLPDAVMEKYNRLCVNLYSMLEQCSDWPVSSYGVKSIAQHLGFKWTAEDASGANSIAWFQEYQNDPMNKDLLARILTYNKEDCEAMIVVKNYLAKNC